MVFLAPVPTRIRIARRQNGVADHPRRWKWFETFGLLFVNDDLVAVFFFLFFTSSYFTCTTCTRIERRGRFNDDKLTRVVLLHRPNAAPVNTVCPFIRTAIVSGSCPTLDNITRDNYRPSYLDTVSTAPCGATARRCACTLCFYSRLGRRRHLVFISRGPRVGTNALGTRVLKNSEKPKIARIGDCFYACYCFD